MRWHFFLALLVMAASTPARSQPSDSKAQKNSRKQDLAKARDDLKHKKFAEMIPICDRILKADPNSIIWLVLRGKAYERLEQPEKAILDFRKAASLGKVNAEAYVVWAQCDVALGKIPQAIKDLDTAIALNEKGETVRARGELYVDQKQYKLALADFTRAIEIEPRQADNYRARGHIFERQGEFQKAVDDYTLAINIRPGDPRIYSERAKAYEKLGRKNLAAQDRAHANEKGFTDMMP
jgi:tetratricopeptide (TPR) repeat protein